MKIRLWFLMILSSALCGCATTIPPDLNAAATNATNAASAANTVNREIREALILGRVYQASAPMELSADFVCSPQSPAATLSAKELGAFADTINTVGKVSAKPSDTSYAGYIAQFKKDHAASAAAVLDQSVVDQKEAEATRKALERCQLLLKQDIAQELNGPVVGAGGSVTAITATVVALDNLIKAVFSATEEVARAKAVRATMQQMVKVMQSAYDKLAEAPDTADYILAKPAGDPSSRLSNTLSIHRWFAAQRLMADWSRIKACAAKDQACLLSAADTFAADGEAYAALSAVNPSKLLPDLKAAVDKAVAANDKASIGDIFDGLSAIGGALSSVNSQYLAFRKTL